jgi:hypothetical protein
MQSPTPDQHIEAARRRLGHLAGLEARTAETERTILAAAESRLEAVDRDLRRLQPRAILDDDAGDQYQALTEERGQLMGIIAQAHMDDQ